MEADLHTKQHTIYNYLIYQCAQVSRRNIIYLNVRQQYKLELKEPTKRDAWLSLQDTSPWLATNSEECDVV